MPETVRATGVRLRSRLRRALMVGASAIALGAALKPAYAGDSLLATIQDTFSVIGRQEVAGLSLTLGLVVFAVLSTVVLLRTRQAASRLEDTSRDEAGA